MKKEKQEESQPINIYGLNIKTTYIPIRGVTSLICERLSPEKKEALIKEQMQTEKGKFKKKDKEPRNPEKEFAESLYPLPDNQGYGFPAVAFKRAAVDAIRSIDGLTMVEAKQMFFVLGKYEKDGEDLIKINGEPRMRRDHVKNATGVLDFRFHGEFPAGWTALLPVQYNANAISEEQIFNLFNLAGFSCGVGSWRPSAPKSKTGQHGKWEIVTDNSVQP